MTLNNKLDVSFHSEYFDIKQQIEYDNKFDLNILNCSIFSLLSQYYISVSNNVYVV